MCLLILFVKTKKGQPGKTVLCAVSVNTTSRDMPPLRLKYSTLNEESTPSSVLSFYAIAPLFSYLKFSLCLCFKESRVNIRNLPVSAFYWMHTAIPYW